MLRCHLLVSLRLCQTFTSISEPTWMKKNELRMLTIHSLTLLKNSGEHYI